MINREQILAKVGIKQTMESKGHVFEKRGKEWFCKCPFHNDNSPSFRVNEEKRVWICDPCGIGGSVIDLISRLENISVGDVLRKYDNEPKIENKPMQPVIKPKPVKAYRYENELGEVVYEAIRYEPKTFRQRRPDGNGGWLWDMEGVTRVLYHLPEILKNDTIWIVEGEKDADNLREVGFIATCNVGGASKWLPAYSEALKGKHVIICPDNDDAGEKHGKLVMESLAGKVSVLQYARIPKEFKDVSDYLETIAKDDRKGVLLQLLMNTPQIKGGIDLPILDFHDMEKEYADLTKNSAGLTLDLSKWIPSFKQCLRPAIPGNIISFLADTGTGKTAILQNLAVSCAPLDVLFFEMELTAADLFERFMQIHTRISGDKLWSTYQEGKRVAWNKEAVKHIHVCTLPRITIETLEKLIVQSELRIGRRPAVVIVDYVQLMKGTGKSRYEKTSEIMEEIKNVAISTKTIIVISSQVHRKDGQGNTDEIGLHDAKDSGSIESSSSIHIGAWRSSEDPERTLIMRINKATRSRKNFTVYCNFHGETMTITEKI